MSKDRAHDSRRVVGPLTGKGKASDAVKGLQDLRNFLITSPLSSAVKSIHVEKKDK